jgi:hypothetical protein
MKDITINNLDQVYQIIEAQSMLKSWTAKNPLWLYSLARQSCPSADAQDMDSITTHIHKRIDYYRRAVATENDSMNLQNYLGYFELKMSLSRDLMRTGSWILSLNLSKQIAPRLSNSFSFLHNYAIIQSCSAALILTEYFNCQKVFLPLKYSNHKFIQNTNLSPEKHYNFQEISDIVAAFNFHSVMGSIKSICKDLKHIPFQYQTLTHRIREYEDYYVMLQNEMAIQNSFLEENGTNSCEEEGETNCSATAIDDDLVNEVDSMLSQRKEAMLKVDFYCFWCWLMPLETIYLFFRPFGFVHEAAHASLLTICDKGCLLFADKYLLKSVSVNNDEQEETPNSNNNASNHSSEESSSDNHPTPTPTTKAKNEEEPYAQMGYFMKSIIIDDIISHDTSIIKKAIYPTSKLRLYFEEILMTGEKQLRIDCDENYQQLFSAGKSATTSTGIAANAPTNSNPVVGNASFFNMLGNAGLDFSAFTGSSPDKQFVDQKTIRILTKLKERHEHYNEELAPFYQPQTSSSSATTTRTSRVNSVETNNYNSSEQPTDGDKQDTYQDDGDRNYWIPLETPKKPQKVYGDQLLTWLLTRGLILLELNRIGEAIMMFKLMECYKETAPRTKFAMFVAYYHLAEIVLLYEVCDFPLLMAAEYLKRASVYLQRAFDSKCYHYIHEYHPKILVSEIVLFILKLIDDFSFSFSLFRN